jgi:DNA-binding transcriptional ArsR family regulator
VSGWRIYFALVIEHLLNQAGGGWTVDAVRELARYFRALGDETRLRLVELLSRQGRARSLCVERLAQELGVTPSAVSQHLRVLKDLGMVQGERRGYRIHYYLDSERLAVYQSMARERLGDVFVPTVTEVGDG